MCGREKERESAFVGSCVCVCACVYACACVCAYLCVWGVTASQRIVCQHVCACLKVKTQVKPKRGGGKTQQNLSTKRGGGKEKP